MNGGWIAALVGFAVGSVAYLFGRYRPPRAVLTLFTTAPLEQGWAAALGDVYALSGKVTDGSNPYSGRAAMIEILDIGSAQGCARHAWGYHYCQTIEGAEAEADEAAAGALAAGASVYYWNAEKQWAGSSSLPGATDPIATAAAFALRFKAQAPQVQLAWNAWTTRAARNQGSPHAIVDTAQLVALFDIWAPMIYGSNPGTIADKWRADVDKYAMSLPGLIRAPMVGSGRETPAGDSMGYFANQGDTPGLRSLVRSSAVPWLCFWYGAGSDGMLTVGNATNPPLTTQIGAMHGDRGLGRRSV